MYGERGIGLQICHHSLELCEAWTSWGAIPWVVPVIGICLIYSSVSYFFPRVGSCVHMVIFRSKMFGI